MVWIVIHSLKLHDNNCFRLSVENVGTSIGDVVGSFISPVPSLAIIAIIVSSAPPPAFISLSPGSA